jgi:hypothetical protein
MTGEICAFLFFFIVISSSLRFMFIFVEVMVAGCAFFFGRFLLAGFGVIFCYGFFVDFWVMVAGFAFSSSGAAIQVMFFYSKWWSPVCFFFFFFFYAADLFTMRDWVSAFWNRKKLNEIMQVSEMSMNLISTSFTRCHASWGCNRQL